MFIKYFLQERRWQRSETHTEEISHPPENVTGEGGREKSKYFLLLTFPVIASAKCLLENAFSNG